MLTATDADTQVGGGVRSDERAAALLSAGADRIVVGTRALDDPSWLEQLSLDHPGCVVVALDTRDGIVLRRGWTEAASESIGAVLERLDALPIAGVLSTDVGREGRLEGIDIEGCRSVVDATRHPVWISGGITSVDDLEALEGVGAYGAVLGMTLYTETIDVDAVSKRWGGAVDTSQEPESSGE